jgi:hypothetical protein
MKILLPNSMSWKEDRVAHLVACLPAGPKVGGLNLGTDKCSANSHMYLQHVQKYAHNKRIEDICL